MYANPTGAVTNPTTATTLRVRTRFAGTVPDVFAAANAVTRVTFNREGFASAAAAGGPIGFVSTKFLLTEPTSNNSYTRCLLVSRWAC